MAGTSASDVPHQSSVMTMTRRVAPRRSSACASSGVIVVSARALTKRALLADIWSMYCASVIPWANRSFVTTTVLPGRIARRPVTLWGHVGPDGQLGMGIDPRNSRAMWEESRRMIPRIWEDGPFSWEGQFWNVPPRDVRPKPYQKPHPPIWVAALQPATYELAAETGIGVMALSVAAPSYLAPHIQKYKERVRHAKPGGKFINDQWLSSTMALCDWDNKGARELAAKSLRTFFGPDRPYLKDQTHLYEQLVASWGGVPEHLKANFARYLKGEGTAGAPDGRSEAPEGSAGAPAVDLSGGSGQIAAALWNQIDADTLVDRG